MRNHAEEANRPSQTSGNAGLPQQRSVGKVVLRRAKIVLGAVTLAVVLSVAGVVLLNHSTPASTGVGTLTTVSVPGAAQTTTTTQAPQGGSNLSLPTESESDSPTAVVTYMEAIYMKAYQTHTVSYLARYYSPSDSGDYNAAVTQLNAGGSVNVYTLSNINVAFADGGGAFTVSFDVENDGFPTHNRTASFEWDSSTQEWEVTHLQ
jgi:hypothetical protein